MELRDILDEIQRNREASAKEHAELKGLVIEIKEDVRGNPERNIEGLIPQVKRHEKILKPVHWVYENRKPILRSIGFVTCVVLECVAETKNVGLITTLISIFK